MAVQRLSLADITQAILDIMMFKKSDNAPWGSNVVLYKRINEYMQRLPMRLNTVGRELAVQGLLKAEDLPLHFGMWQTTATSATTGSGLKIAAGSSTVLFPTNFDSQISLYDITGKRNIPIIEGPDAYLNEELTEAPAGAPKCLHLVGFATDATEITSYWRRSGTLYPSTVSGITPSMRLTYYRLPAIMAGSVPPDEFPDVDPKYEYISVVGPVCDLARNTGFEFDRYAVQEKEMLTEMCLTARSK